MYKRQAENDPDNAEDAKQQRNAGKYPDDFAFAPTTHFKMVVDGAHFKDPLACGLETDDLQYNQMCIRDRRRW